MDATQPNTAPDRTARGISDRRFTEQLAAIEKLKHFLFKEKVAIQAEHLENVDLGSLNNLEYNPQGRLPTEDEWRALDQRLLGLTSLLTPELRLKLRISELSFFFKRLPILFMSTTVIATLILCTLNRSGLDRDSFLYTLLFITSLILWTVSQGGLGACAFLGVSLATQTPDDRSSPDHLYSHTVITDENILNTRTILGSLFALLIGLPLSNEALDVIWKSIFGQGQMPALKDYLIVLAPFMFGFSTSLVLGIFSRIVNGIEALFGISSPIKGGEQQPIKAP